MLCAAAEVLLMVPALVIVIAEATNPRGEAVVPARLMTAPGWLVSDAPAASCSLPAPVTFTVPVFVQARLNSGAVPVMLVVPLVLRMPAVPVIVPPLQSKVPLIASAPLPPIVPLETAGEIKLELPLMVIVAPAPLGR